MGKKKSKKKAGVVAVTTHIYGIFDTKKQEIIFVSLNLEDTEMELAMMDDRYCRCEFSSTLLL